MMGLGLRFGWRLLSSRAGSGHGAVRSAVGLNVYDKRQAINAVREGFVQQFELTAAQAELDALRRRMAAAAEANRALQ
ncbi:MAG: hypothetical protein JJ894_08660 [Dinoroseobacter sp.]|nr:hypothetical protein [Dinoroseobacter sp.]